MYMYTNDILTQATSNSNQTLQLTASQPPTPRQCNKELEKRKTKTNFEFGGRILTSAVAAFRNFQRRKKFTDFAQKIRSSVGPNVVSGVATFSGHVDKRFSKIRAAETERISVG
eukprot:gene8519-10258_t